VYQHGAWRQPSQLVAAAVALAIFAALWSLRDRFPKEGELFRAYLVLYGLGRFGVEFLRERPIAFAGLSMAQLVCLEIAVSGALFLALGRRSAARPVPLEDMT
jgi:phosphatidylglycerol:prolipoprotein diacylglycerol transferase